MRINSNIFLICCVIFFSIPFRASALGEFTTTMKTEYVVNGQGMTSVKQEIHIKNNYSSVFVTQYALEINSNNLDVIRAYTPDGNQLEVHATQAESKTSIALVFPDRAIGKDKERIFFLEYESPETAMLSGDILELNIPKLSNPEDIQDYQVTVFVPHQFGNPAFSKPQTYAIGQNTAETIYTFTQGAKEGITILFGEKQTYGFELKYHLNNPSISQGIMQIALPPDTAYQKIHYDFIKPLPDSIERDDDGNWIATYTVAAQKEEMVKVTGTAQTFLQPVVQVPVELPDKRYIKDLNYWQTKDPAIQHLAKELKIPKKIYDYVVETLTYDYTRLQSAAQLRKGAVGVLQNPSSALCQEFTDLFIAIARSAGIPAREINGYAFTRNKTLRPLSLVADVLHAWPEYFDTTKNQWIPIDPTWGNTTSNVDFFSKLDFNHIAFVIHGVSSEQPFSAGMYKIPGKEEKDIDVYTKEDVETQSNLEIELERASFNSKSDILVKNLTGSAWYDIPISLTVSPELVFAKEVIKTVPILLPYQTVPVQIPVRRSSLQFSNTGKVTATVGGKTIEYEVKTSANIWIGMGVGVGIITFFAGGVLVYRRKQ